MCQAVDNGWNDYPSHIFPKIVEGTSVILKAIGVGNRSSESGGEIPAPTMDSGHDKADVKPVEPDGLDVAASAAAAEISSSSSSCSSSSESGEEEDGDLDASVVDRSIGEGRALLCGFDWLIRRKAGELWPMLLEINTSPQLVCGRSARTAI